jgi:hypothetical protein
MAENDKAAADKAAADQAAADKAAADKAVTDKAAADQAVIDKAAADQAVIDKAAADTVERTGITETLDATVPDDASAPSFEQLVESRYDPDKSRDETRSYIAYWLLLLLTMVVVAAFTMLFAVHAATFENLKSVLELILGPIVALVSAATGFYFGSQQSGKK